MKKLGGAIAFLPWGCVDPLGGRPHVPKFSLGTNPCSDSCSNSSGCTLGLDQCPVSEAPRYDMDDEQLAS